MSDRQFGNIAIKEKFDGSVGSRKHLVNKKKHIMRQHNEDTMKNKNHKSIDYDKSHLNSTLIDLSNPGENMNQTVNRILKERGIEEDKTNKIRAVSGILSIPSEYLNDPEKLKLFEKQSLEFFNSNENFKGNVLLAQTNYDEKQPHIEFIFVPHHKETNKLNFNKMFGSEYEKTWDPVKKKQISKLVSDGRKKLEKLHDEFANTVSKPLGLERGDGTHTNKLSNKEYMKAISDMKNDEKLLLANDFPEPPKPKEKPDDLVFNRGKIIELQQKEIKELRDYIKKTRNDRNLLRSSKGILKQAQARNKDRINLKNKIESQQAEIDKNNQIIVETFGTDKPKQSEISAVRDKFKQMKRERELEEENKIKKENEKQEKLNQKRFIEDLEARNKLKRQLELDEEKRGVKKPAFRTPAYKPPGPNEKN